MILDFTSIGPFVEIMYQCPCLRSELQTIGCELDIMFPGSVPAFAAE